MDLTLSLECSKCLMFGRLDCYWELNGGREVEHELAGSLHSGWSDGDVIEDGDQVASSEAQSEKEGGYDADDEDSSDETLFLPQEA